MANPYRFTAEEPHDYPTVPGLGTVKPGDVACFDHRPPDHRWTLVEPGDNDQDGVAGQASPDDGPRRPALNAAKVDWQAYVAALGEPANAIDGKTTKELQARAEELDAERAAADGGAEK